MNGIKVKDALSVELSKLECASLTTLLDPRDSWVIDEHQPLLTPTRDTLLTLITVDSKSISKRVRSKHKRTRTIVKNLSVEDCFSIVDHVVERINFQMVVLMKTFTKCCPRVEQQQQQQTSLYLRLNSYNWLIQWVYWMAVVTC